jgi:hypothetical protein
MFEVACMDVRTRLQRVAQLGSFGMALAAAPLRRSNRSSSPTWSSARSATCVNPTLDGRLRAISRGQRSGVAPSSIAAIFEAEQLITWSLTDGDNDWYWFVDNPQLAKELTLEHKDRQ